VYYVMMQVFWPGFDAINNIHGVSIPLQHWETKLTRNEQKCMLV